MNSPASPELPGPEPLWLPLGVTLDALPQTLRSALTEIINPAYQELVQEAPSALEKTSGRTYLNLLWLELVEQFNLGNHMWQKGPYQVSADGYSQFVAGHLRLVGIKDKLAKFLLQAKVVREKYGC